jgi:Ankyrin repeats (3 copies)/Ankyrin repeat
MKIKNLFFMMLSIIIFSTTYSMNYDYTLEQVKQLVLEKGIDINASDNSGWTLLYHASAEGDYTLTKWLVSNGAIVNKPNNLGLTPLHIAASRSYIDILKLLIKYNAAIDAPNIYGSTPLHYAAGWGSGEAVKALINYGATVNALNDNGSTPLDLTHIFDQAANKKLLDGYSNLEQKIYKKPTKKKLEKAIKNDFVVLTCLLFEKLAIKPTHNYLNMAKQHESIEVGSLIIRYLGIIGPKFAISKTGIRNAFGLYIPKEIAVLIASYLL